MFIKRIIQQCFVQQHSCWSGARAIFNCGSILCVLWPTAPAGYFAVEAAPRLTLYWGQDARNADKGAARLAHRLDAQGLRVNYAPAEPDFIAAVSPSPLTWQGQVPVGLVHQQMMRLWDFISCSIRSRDAIARHCAACVQEQHSDCTPCSAVGDG